MMRALAALSLVTALAAQAPADPVSTWLGNGELRGLLTLYRDLHRRPEISFREIETSKRFAAELAGTGATVVRNVGGLGVVATIENGEGPTLMLRADLDALPIGEQTGLEYQSEIRAESQDGRVEGVMHACGHDLHMTVLIGAARYLAEHKDAWRGTLVCIGQPAEERGSGARAMLADGLFERVKRPDFAVALHCAADLATGTIGHRAGLAMANADSVDITLFGRGGHGSTPHLTIDPILIGAQLVVDLQAIVAREVSPFTPAVVTVGAIHGGTKHNIIPDRCDLQLTVRSLDDATRTQLRTAIERRTRAAAAGAGAPEPLIAFSEGVPALANDPALTARVVAAVAGALGDDRLQQVEPVMGAEDFSEFGRAGVPICMLRLGTIAPERLARFAAAGEQPPSLHSSRYYPDPEDAARTGVRALVAAALDLCKR